nr:MAG TPA: hypothetical protein [Caudoviricetes sp.]
MLSPIISRQFSHCRISLSFESLFYRLYLYFYICFLTIG